jgi:MFS family permease
VKTADTPPGTPGTGGYKGPLGLFEVPYTQETFGFHWFQFYNAICFQIILGAPIVLLAKDLGANSVILGVIASFTPLMTVLQLPAARYLSRYSYRSFALMGWGLRSLFIGTSAVVPLLFFLSPEVRLWILLGSLFFFNVLRGIATAAFMPWLTGIVPATVRGRFISVDHTFINAGSLLAMLLSALLMKDGAEPWRYSLVLWISVATAVVSLLYLRRIPDARHGEMTAESSVKVPFVDMALLAPFRNWVLFSLLFVLVGGGLGVFPVEYLKDQARFSPYLIYMLSTGTFLAPMIILQAVGKRVDRSGSIPLIRMSLLAFALVLGIWFMMSAGVITPSWWLVLLLNVSGGAAMASFNMANGHLWMSVVPESGKNHYFAVSTVIVSLVAGVVPLLWGCLLDSLGGLDIVAGPFHLRRHSVYFLGITLLCLASLLASRILIQPGKHGDPGERLKAEG